MRTSYPRVLLSLLALPCGVALAAAPASSGDVAKPSTTAASHAAPTPAAPKAAPQNGQDQVLYELGVLLSQSLDTFRLSEDEFAKVRSGFSDGYHHRADTNKAQSFMTQVQALQRSRALLVAQEEKQHGQAYQAKAAAVSGAHRTSSGLVYQAVTEGTGPTPGVSDQVKVNYEGTLIDGSVFDSSYQRGVPATFGVSSVIPCWTEALQLMKVGGKAHVVCPPELAYGDVGALPKIKPGSTLVFTIELLGIQPAASAAPQATAPPAAGAQQ